MTTPAPISEVWNVAGTSIGYGLFTFSYFLCRHRALFFSMVALVVGDEWEAIRCTVFSAIVSDYLVDRVDASGRRPGPSPRPSGSLPKTRRITPQDQTRYSPIPSESSLAGGGGLFQWRCACVLPRGPVCLRVRTIFSYGMFSSKKLRRGI